ncbi:hypothetical protein D9M72_300950 [compost metagenome]
MFRRGQFLPVRRPHACHQEPRVFFLNLPGEQPLVRRGAAQETHPESQLLSSCQEGGSEVAAGQPGPAVPGQPLRLSHERRAVEQIEPVHRAGRVCMQRACPTTADAEMMQVVQVDGRHPQRWQSPAAGPGKDEFQSRLGIHQVNRCAAQDYLVSVQLFHVVPQFCAGTSCPLISK